MPWQTLLALAIALALAVLGTRASASWLTPVSGAALALSLAGIVSVVPGLSDEQSAVAMRLCNVGGTLLMLLWGARFVSVSRGQAFAEVSGAALWALALYCAACACCQAFGTLPGALLAVIAASRVVSSAVLLFLQLKERVGNATTWEGEGCPPRVRVEFLATRAVLGVCMGFVQGAGALAILSDAVPSSSSAVASAVMAVLAFALLFAGNRRPAAARLVPVLPLASLVMPTIWMTDASPGLSLVYPSVWLGWICLSSTQLSELKYSMRVRPLCLAFGEKALVLLSILAGNFLVARASAVLPDLGDVFPATLVVATVLCVFVSLKLAGLATLRDHEAFVQEVIADSHEALGYVYGQVARDCGLSSREREILGMLAQGHTQAFAASELGVAPGTVRSHVNHIYAKTRCHSREELLALVERYKSAKE